eukprot:TRINITY_DN622_c0_g1_i1.p1 TRINITY_DN622_c0_g1~~TRINITY_DN622_c0_g1_i1.p1  ORF type:complete len:1111 (-),score=322.45 TRINITY_DN622_c0_g1_i1:339-3671(-)
MESRPKEARVLLKNPKSFIETPLKAVSTFIPSLSDYVALSDFENVDIDRKDKAITSEFYVFPDKSSSWLCISYSNGFQIWDVTDSDHTYEIISDRQNRLFVHQSAIVVDSKTNFPIIVLVCDVQEERGLKQVNLYSTERKSYINAEGIRHSKELSISAFDSRLVVWDGTAMTVFQMNDIGTQKPQQLLTLPLFKSTPTPLLPVALKGDWIALPVDSFPRNFNEPENLGNATETVVNQVVSAFSELSTTLKSWTQKGKEILKTYLNDDDSRYMHQQLYKSQKQQQQQQQQQQEGNESSLAHGMVFVWDMRLKRTLAHFRAHPRQLSAMTFNESANLLATADVYGQSIHIFQILPPRLECKQDHRLLYRLQCGITYRSLTSLRFSTDSLLLQATSDAGTIHLFALNPQGGQAHSSTHIASRLITPITSGVEDIGTSPISHASSGVVMDDESSDPFNQSPMRRPHTTNSPNILSQRALMTQLQGTPCITSDAVARLKLRGLTQVSSTINSGSSSPTAKHHGNGMQSGLSSVSSRSSSAHSTNGHNGSSSTNSSSTTTNNGNGVQRHPHMDSMIHEEFDTSSIRRRNRGEMPSRGPPQRPTVLPTCVLFEDRLLAFDGVCLSTHALHMTFYGSPDQPVSLPNRLEPNSDIYAAPDFFLNCECLGCSDVLRASDWPARFAFDRSMITNPRSHSSSSHLASKRIHPTSWISQVEINTHSPIYHTPLWASPQFRFHRFSASPDTLPFQQPFKMAQNTVPIIGDGVSDMEGRKSTETGKEQPMREQVVKNNMNRGGATGKRGGKNRNKQRNRNANSSLSPESGIHTPPQVPNSSNPTGKYEDSPNTPDMQKESQSRDLEDGWVQTAPFELNYLDSLSSEAVELVRIGPTAIPLSSDAAPTAYPFAIGQHISDAIGQSIKFAPEAVDDGILHQKESLDHLIREPHVPVFKAPVSDFSPMTAEDLSEHSIHDPMFTAGNMNEDTIDDEETMNPPRPIPVNTEESHSEERDDVFSTTGHETNNNTVIGGKTGMSPSAPSPESDVFGGTNNNLPTINGLTPQQQRDEEMGMDHHHNNNTTGSADSVKPPDSIFGSGNDMNNEEISQQQQPQPYGNYSDDDCW